MLGVNSHAGNTQDPTLTLSTIKTSRNSNNSVADEHKLKTMLLEKDREIAHLKLQLKEKITRDRVVEEILS